MDTPLPPRSRLLLSWFTRYTRRYIKKHFTAVRLANTPPVLTGPTIIYLNHPSWWDPLVCLLLAQTYYPGRAHYAPIDEQALEKYRFFAKLGFIAVEPNSARGARQLLSAADAILPHPTGTLWITAAGEFTDPRTRPVTLMPGLAHLARRFPAATLVPLALEYPFWHERLPEALVRFGEPLQLSQCAHGHGWTPRAILRTLEAELESTLDDLAVPAMCTDVGAFTVLARGRTGTTFLYDACRRIRAALAGQRFFTAHGDGR